MKAYPTFTEENFEEMFRKHIRISRGRGHILKGKKPRNSEEFAALTKATIGVSLHLKTARPGYYEILEDYNFYRNMPLVQLWNRKFQTSYAGAKIALQTTFGQLGTGGTARAEYGSFKVISHRDKIRIANFQK